MKGGLLNDSIQCIAWMKKVKLSLDGLANATLKLYYNVVVLVYTRVSGYFNE